MLEQFKTLFSPHTRGCSSIRGGSMKIFCVFPAYAGMFLVVGGAWALSWCFPRIRGDVPPHTPVHCYDLWFSPHTRGCSFATAPAAPERPVFPAYAGMFRYRKRKKIFEGRFPRIRGDVPWALAPGQNSSWFSPHTRGCSWWLRCARPLGCVFPAYAGMFLSVRVMRRVSSGFPRIRGDVPLSAAEVIDSGGFPRIRGDVPRRAQAEYVKALFSPHTRGCSVMAAFRGGDDGVFPAYAGMFRFA